MTLNPICSSISSLLSLPLSLSHPFPSLSLSLFLSSSAAVQENLLSADWEDDVMLHADAAEERTGEREGEGRVLWRGLRVRIGIHSGTPRCVPDSITGEGKGGGEKMRERERKRGICFCVEGGCVFV